MKQLQIIEPGKVAWREVPLPKPGPGELLVKVLAVTTCPHWDLHLMRGEPMFPSQALSYPYTPGQPGHEAMGEIAALGAGVIGAAPGTRVAVWRDPGHDRPGCYAQYACVDAQNVIPVPVHLEPQAIAPLELAMCVQVSFDQLLRLDAVCGKRFGISGLGPAGLVAVQMAKAYGAREVVGIDPLPARRALAKCLGADIVLAPDADVFPASRGGEQALDAAIDCTGLKVSIEFLLDRTRQVVAIFGVLREDVIFGARHWSGLSLLGYGRHNRSAAERALVLVTKGQLDLAPLVTHTMPLQCYQEGIELLRAKKAIKVCFLPQECK
ncbi:MAG: zinc-binding dehydrogenase [Anaerolineae bacterium]|nr:zinc-binding dehydrogenase [Anaerolineae bacterium]